MAEKKKGKKRKEAFSQIGEEEDKPTKQEFAVAKWMRKNVPIKKTKFLNHVVEYFTARRAVDALMESKFVTQSSGLFETREEIVDYMHGMLLHKFFHRARKVPVSEHELKSKKKEKKVESENEKEKPRDAKEKDKGTDAESSVVESKQDTQSDKEKRKKKIRLEMHNDQRFVDGLDAYVWIYDPIPFYYWIFGTLVVLGAVGVCLFPLWPPSVRNGVYYLSMAGAFFLAFIVVLTILRHIIFCFIWLVTMGKHHLWILPNLTEDVGFFASFWPLYQYEYKGDLSDKKKGKKKKKDKDSDAEDDDSKEEQPPPVSEKDSKSKIPSSDKPAEDRSGDKASAEAGSQVEVLNPSESESESSQRSSTGKDFEMVDQDDLDS